MAMASIFAAGPTSAHLELAQLALQRVLHETGRPGCPAWT